MQHIQSKARDTQPVTVSRHYQLTMSVIILIYFVRWHCHRTMSAMPGVRWQHSRTFK